VSKISQFDVDVLCMFCTDTLATSGNDGIYQKFLKVIITSPMGVVAKYCNEHVCVCVSVCLFASTSPEPHARSLQTLYVLHIAVARSSSGGVMPSKGERAILGFSPLTMHCTA